MGFSAWHAGRCGRALLPRCPTSDTFATSVQRAYVVYPPEGQRPPTLEEVQNVRMEWRGVGAGLAWVGVWEGEREPETHDRRGSDGAKPHLRVGFGALLQVCV